MTQNNYQLNPNTFRQFRDFIYERSGIFFSEGKLYLLESRLGRRLRELELDSFEEYFTHLRRMVNQKDELSKIFNLITINETYFFRYEKQLRAFSDKLLPDLIDRKANIPGWKIRVWCAGCSSGEEIYTIAMLLKEDRSNYLINGKVDLLATDISQRTLAQARDGVYKKNSFRGSMPPLYKSKYFSIKGKIFRINEDFKKVVRFDYLNLNDLNKNHSPREMDFIFCRNVLIYFDEIMKKRVIRSFYDVLNHGGYLFLGEAESLHGISSAFKVEHFPGTFVYKKE